MNSQEQQKIKTYIRDNKNNQKQLKTLFKKLCHNFESSSDPKIIKLLDFLNKESPNTISSLKSDQLFNHQKTLVCLLQNYPELIITGHWFETHIEKWIEPDQLINQVQSKTLEQLSLTQEKPVGWQCIELVNNFLGKHKDDSMLFWDTMPVLNHDKMPTHNEKIEIFKQLTEKVTQCDNLYFNNKGTLNFLYESGISFNFKNWDWTHITATPSILNTLSSTNHFRHVKCPYDMHGKTFEKIPSFNSIDFDNDELFETLNDFLAQRPELWFNKQGPCFSILEIQKLHDYSIMDTIAHHINTINEFNDKNLLETFMIFAGENNLEKIDKLMDNNNQQQWLETIKKLTNVFRDFIETGNSVNLGVDLDRKNTLQLADSLKYTDYKPDKAAYIFCLVSQLNNFDSAYHKKHYFENYILRNQVQINTNNTKKQSKML